LEVFMAEEPIPESPEAEEEFQRVLRNVVNTPHKPHEKKLGPKAAPPES
jgi:hypothetical protein